MTVPSDLLVGFTDPEHIHCIIDAEGRLISVSQGLQQWTGCEASDLMKLPFYDQFLQKGGVKQKLKEQKDHVIFLETRYHGHTGSVRWINWLVGTESTHGLRLAVGVDVTWQETRQRQFTRVLKQSWSHRAIGTGTDPLASDRWERHLIWLAFHDTVTGLPNRHLFEERLAQWLLLSQRNHWTLGLMLLDLDSFKEVNDRWGHRIGDCLLRQVGKRLSSHLRASDTVARLGGDEFAILLPQIGDSGNAWRVQEKLHRVFLDPFSVSHVQIGISSSIGVAIYPTDATDSSGLLKVADENMYKTKKARGLSANIQ